MSSHLHRRSAWLMLALPLALLCGCAQKMNVDPKYEPFAASDFFRDGSSARLPVTGTVYRGAPPPDSIAEAGVRGNQWVDGFPFTVTRQRLENGQRYYNGFCSPCHGYTGDGNGMIVQRGLRGPVTFHEARFRRYPTGYFFEVITNGRGGMYPYGPRIPAEQRWEIIAYLRALQYSQNAPLSALPPEQQAALAALQEPR